MQRLENDMDDLFRKAAENYPLKVSDNDWDNLVAKIAEASAVSPAANKNSGGKRKYLFTGILLLLLLVTGGLSYKYLSGKNASSAADERDLPGAVVNNSSTQTIKEKNNPANSTIAEYDLNRPNTIKGDESNDYKPVKAEKFFESNSDVMHQSDAEEAIENFNTNNNERWTSLPPFTITANNETKKQGLLMKRNSPLANAGEITLRNNGNKPGFYWGLAAGPQLNEVKSQGMNKAGFDFGLVAGYRLNKRLSLESGLFFSTKYYYSEGKYFKMSKPDPTMPADMKLMSLQGKSNIFEVPVKVRYNLINNFKSNVYATAGIASYILTQENNKYHAMVNGTPEDMQRSYDQLVHYAAASVNFSAGYEYKLLKRNSIRVEPYVQIPLKGIGVGAMPVTSAGLHIGFTWNRK